MKTRNWNELGDIDDYKIPVFNEKNFNNFLDRNRNIKSFFDFLNAKKIQFEILYFIESSYLFLKILTIEPKFFFIGLNRDDSQKFLFKFEDLSFIKEKFLLNKNANNTFLIYLDSSIRAFKDVHRKAKYIPFRNIPLMEEFKRIKETNVRIFIKKELRKGVPLGKYNINNKLNDLTGKEWIKFTKSWFILNPPPRNDVEILHPAKFPESLIERYIRFFTKEKQIILDPFMGTGSTLLAAKNTMRSCIGVEINNHYKNIALSRLAQETLDKWVIINNKPLIHEVINGDSNNLEEIWETKNFPKIDFCITSPPYWNQLKRNSIRQKTRITKGLDTFYSGNPKDLGNIDDYGDFLTIQKNIFNQVYNILKNKCYLVIITNNLFFNGKLYPLAFDTAISLADEWVLKDEQVWCQDNKRLIALGVNNAYVGNRHHVYCLVFRKEENP